MAMQQTTLDLGHSRNFQTYVKYEPVTTLQDAAEVNRRKI